MPSTLAATDRFTADERRKLGPYFGNTESPVFVLTNLPEAVKGALFARYSRSAKSARRLFLDEFLGDLTQEGAPSRAGPGSERAERLYSKVLSEYGDDSVAQLGGAHIACEGVSNVLTKVLERGRLMSYLEQSTRYVPYTQRPDGRWKYVVPAEIEDPEDRELYIETLDRAFETYASLIKPMQDHYGRKIPRRPNDSDVGYRAAIRAKALDTLRGLLPAATRSNVGIYGSGQAFEALLLRMGAHPLAESREVADLMLRELRKVIPAFVQRVDVENRGIRWQNYLRERNQRTRELASEFAPEFNVHGTRFQRDETRDEVTLVDFDRDGEIKVIAAALYSGSDTPLEQLVARARAMPPDQRTQVLQACMGKRGNRRHRPGRAFEHASYTFDILSDYGAFRDLQRHRMLTIDWQDLTTGHGFARADAIEEVGALQAWERVMDDSAELYERLTRHYSTVVAQYAVSLAYRIRFQMHMNAREAMHVIELRTTPQGHGAYRRICQKMHNLIATKARHHAIASAMNFVDHSEVEAERLEAERRKYRPLFPEIAWGPGQRLISANPPQSNQPDSRSNETTRTAQLPLAGLEDGPGAGP